MFLGGLDSVTGILQNFSPHLLVIVLAIHVFETGFIQQTRLRKHGVAVGSGVWFAWIASTFFEGFGSIKRFDREVRRLQRAEEKEAKH